MKCFHVAIQGTHKFVVMGHINFEDHALIKRWRVGKKMNATSEKLNDEKTWGNCQKQFTIIVGGCVYF